MLIAFWVRRMEQFRRKFSAALIRNISSFAGTAWMTRTPHTIPSDVVAKPSARVERTCLQILVL